jgi:hypothetical protein
MSELSAQPQADLSLAAQISDMLGMLGITVF